MYRLIAIAVLMVSLIVGSFFVGVHKERNRTKLGAWEAFAGRVDKALKVADEYVKLGQNFADTKVQIQEVTKTVVRKQVEYVKANNLPDVPVPTYVLGLRSCQIARIRKAAGYPVPGGDYESLCTTGDADR